MPGPSPRDSRESRDSRTSRDFREPPDRRRQRRIRLCIEIKGVIFSHLILEVRSTGPLHSPRTQTRKKSTKINFLGLETARWGGVLPREGVVAKKFVLSLESLSSLGFEERSLGCPGNFFCREIPDPWGRSKSLCQKSSCAFLVPFETPTSSLPGAPPPTERANGRK